MLIQRGNREEAHPVNTSRPHRRRLVGGWMLRPPLMRRYASRAMSSMRTALKGTAASVIRERILPWTAAEPPVRNPLASPSLRNCISRIIGVSPPISTLHRRLLPKWRKLCQRDRERRGAKPPSSGGVEFLGVLEPRGGCLPRSLPCQLGRDGGWSYRGYGSYWRL